MGADQTKGAEAGRDRPLYTWVCYVYTRYGDFETCGCDAKNRYTMGADQAQGSEASCDSSLYTLVYHVYTC